MNANAVYKQNQTHATGGTRIDLLLALYDGAIERIDKAIDALNRGNPLRGQSLAARAQLIVMQLAAGVRLDADAEMGANILRLYEFVTRQLASVDIRALEAAKRVLATLREGFQGCRSEAIKLERSGQIPSAADVVVVTAQA